MSGGLGTQAKILEALAVREPQTARELIQACSRTTVGVLLTPMVQRGQLVMREQLQAVPGKRGRTTVRYYARTRAGLTGEFLGEASPGGRARVGWNSYQKHGWDICGEDWCPDEAWLPPRVAGRCAKKKRPSGCISSGRTGISEREGGRITHLQMVCHPRNTAGSMAVGRGGGRGSTGTG